MTIVALDPLEFRCRVSSTILGGYCGVSSMTSPCGISTKPKLDAAQAKFGTKARAKRVDITKPEEVERAAKESKAAMGHVDILVCSAGVAGLNADVVDYPIDEWKRVFDTNINGLLYCARYIGPLTKPADTATSSTSRQWPAKRLIRGRLG